jgi:hypothetical protein
MRARPQPMWPHSIFPEDCNATTLRGSLESTAECRTRGAGHRQYQIRSQPPQIDRRINLSADDGPRLEDYTSAEDWLT